mgnify:CR=1 FL=1
MFRLKKAKQSARNWFATLKAHRYRKLRTFLANLVLMIVVSIVIDILVVDPIKDWVTFVSLQ